MRLTTVRFPLSSMILAGVLAASLQAADPQLVGLLMPDAKVVAGINAEQARNSPFGQFLLSSMPNNNGRFQTFSASTGFDPRRDLQEVIVASRADASHSGLLVAKGVFNSAKIFALARADGQITTLYNGVEMLNGKSETDSTAMAFLNGSIAIAGDSASVRAAIDRRDKPSALDSVLAAKIDALSATQDAWTVSIAPVAALGGKVPDSNLNGMLQGDLLKSVQQASAGVKFGAVVQFSGEAVARTAQDAAALADVVRFLANMAQTNAPQSASALMTSLTQSLTIQANKEKVTVNLGIPENLLETILATHGAKAAAYHAR